jgi:transcriptional regulator HMO1
VTANKLISSLFSLAKAAQESSNATIDFFNSISHTGNVAGGELANVLNSIGIAGAEIAKATAGTQGIDSEEKLVVNGKRKRAKKAPVDPDAPKKPVTVYFLYASEARKIIRDEREKLNEPALNNTDMTSEIARRWKGLNEEEKEPFKQLYQRKLADYNVEKQEYEGKKAAGIHPLKSAEHAANDYGSNEIDEDVADMIKDGEKSVDSSPSKSPKKKKRDSEKEDKSKKEKKKDKKKRKSDAGTQ